MAETLTPQQKMAVSNRGGNLLVSAAAGSGKTKVLVDRLMQYIRDPNDPANLDEFLLITYTKAAASELRGKIGNKLSEIIAQEPENRHLRKQMQRLYLAKISTVHSFCADILREYAYKLDIAPDFRVADENECMQLQVRALEQVLENGYESAGTNPDFCAFVDGQGLGRDDKQIPDILLKVYQSAQCHLDPDGWLETCVQMFDTEDVSDVGQTVWGAYLIQDLISCVSLHLNALRACEKRAAQAEGFDKPAVLLALTCEQLERLCRCTTWDEICNFPSIDYGRLTFSKKCTDILLQEQIKAIRNACKNAVGKKIRAFTDRSSDVFCDLQDCSSAARGMAELVRQFDQQYNSLKRSRRILDFSDLEHKMLELLLGKSRSGMTQAAKEVSSRFREIMIDEYQDSNGVQDEIFDVLTKQKNNCFMVGDVKQSIYQFRLADPGIFLEKYSNFANAEFAIEGHGRKVLLSSNFRSSGGVIEAVNHVFEHAMSPSVGGLYYGEEEMLREGIPHCNLGEPEVELYAVQVQEDTYFEEAGVVAKRIMQLLDGSHMIRQGDRLRAIQPEDIVILLRSPGSVGVEFSQALEKCGIPCTTGAHRDLLTAQEVDFLRSLLQVIWNPLQDIPLISVLMSPVFGFTAEMLAKIRAANRSENFYNALQSDPSAITQQFLSLLEQLRQEARSGSLTELLEYILLHTEVYNVFSAMPDGKERTQNLHNFCQLAGDYQNGGRKDIAGFLEHLVVLEEKGIGAAGTMPGGAVTIMSIHKSKGLEFPVVFLCGLSRVFNLESARDQVLCHKELGFGLNCADHVNRIRYPSVAKRAISAKIIAESISEELRVLYVAMTRARDRLIMTYAARNLETELKELAMRLDLTSAELLNREVDCSGTWVLLGALRRTDAGELFSLSCHPECASVQKIPWKIHVTEYFEAYPGATDSTDSQIQDDIPADRMREALAFSYAYPAAVSIPSKQTATQIKGRAKDQEAAEGTHPKSKLQFRTPAFLRESGKQYGNVIHSVMQFIRFENCGDVSGVEKEIDRLVSRNLITETDAAKINPRVIADFFSTELGRKIRLSSKCIREFKFSLLMDAETYYPDVSGEKVLLQGVVDCALIEQDGITLIDFKSDHVTETTIDQIAENYRMQVLAYSQALEKIYQLPVKEMYLYFFSLNRFYLL